MAPPPRDCPCHSGLRYGACCAPYHRGGAHAPTPAALMRSRYAAFALSLGEYLYDTLAPAHPDRAAPRAEFTLRLARGLRPRRYLGLTIAHESSEGDSGEVLFFAKIFEKGQNLSFAELSAFCREGAAWRYESGLLVPHAALPGGPFALTRERFIELAASR